MNLATILNALGAASASNPISHVDLVLVATMTFFVVQLALKPLIARQLDPSGSGFDAAVPAASALCACVLIMLGAYLPGVFQILSASVFVATGGVGVYRIAKTGVSAPAPAATPTPATPAPAPAEVSPVTPS